MQRQLIEFDVKPEGQDLNFLKKLMPVLSKPYLDPKSETWVVDFLHHKDAKKIKENLIIETKFVKGFFSRYFMGIASFKKATENPGINIIKEQYDYWFKKASAHLKSATIAESEESKYHKRSYDAVDSNADDKATTPLVKKLNTTSSLLKDFAVNQTINSPSISDKTNDSDEESLAEFNEENFAKDFDDAFNDPNIIGMTSNWLNTAAEPQEEPCTEFNEEIFAKNFDDTFNDPKINELISNFLVPARQLTENSTDDQHYAPNLVDDSLGLRRQ